MDKAIQRRVDLGQDAGLRPSHYYPARVCRATGVPIRSVSRAQRNLLIEVENHRPFWRYSERSRGDRAFWVPVGVSETVASALIGRPLSSLVDTPAPLAGLIIAGVAAEDGGTRLGLASGWARRPTR